MATKIYGVVGAEKAGTHGKSVPKVPNRVKTGGSGKSVPKVPQATKETRLVISRSTDGTTSKMKTAPSSYTGGKGSTWRMSDTGAVRS